LGLIAHAASQFSCGPGHSSDNTIIRDLHNQQAATIHDGFDGASLVDSAPRAVEVIELHPNRTDSMDEPGKGELKSGLDPLFFAISHYRVPLANLHLHGMSPLSTVVVANSPVHACLDSPITNHWFSHQRLQSKTCSLADEAVSRAQVTDKAASHRQPGLAPPVHL
jgi:hypothetical protein